MAKILAKKFEKYLKLIFTDIEVDSRLVSGDIRVENVGVRCELLQELLQEAKFPNLAVTRAFCSSLHIRIPWSKIRTESVSVTIDCLEIVIKEPESLSRCEPHLLPLLLGNKAKSGGSGKASKPKKVNWNVGLDIAAGVHLTIKSIKVSVESLLGLGEQEYGPVPRLLITISDLEVVSTDGQWSSINLKQARKISRTIRGEISLFKQVTISSIRIAIATTESRRSDKQIANFPLCLRAAVSVTSKDVKMTGCRCGVEISQLSVAVDSDQLPPLLHLMLAVGKCVFRKPEANDLIGGISTQDDIDPSLLLEEDDDDDAASLAEVDSDNESATSEAPSLATVDTNASFGGGAGGAGALSGFNDSIAEDSEASQTTLVCASIVCRRLSVTLFDTSKPGAVSMIEVVLSPAHAPGGARFLTIEIKVDQSVSPQEAVVISTNTTMPPVLVYWRHGASNVQLAEICIEQFKTMYVDPAPPPPLLAWQVQTVVSEFDINFRIIPFHALYRMIVNPEISKLLTAMPHLIAQIYAVESAFCVRHGEFAASLTIHAGKVYVPLSMSPTRPVPVLSSDLPTTEKPEGLYIVLGRLNMSSYGKSHRLQNGGHDGFDHSAAYPEGGSLFAARHSVVEINVASVDIQMLLKQQQPLLCVCDGDRHSESLGTSQAKGMSESNDSAATAALSVRVTDVTIGALLPLPLCDVSDPMQIPTTAHHPAMQCLHQHWIVHYGNGTGPWSSDLLPPAICASISVTDVQIALSTAAIAPLADLGCAMAEWAVQDHVVEELVFWPEFIARVMSELSLLEALPATLTAVGSNRVRMSLSLDRIAVVVTTEQPFTAATMTAGLGGGGSTEGITPGVGESGATASNDSGLMMDLSVCLRADLDLHKPLPLQTADVELQSLRVSMLSTSVDDGRCARTPLVDMSVGSGPDPTLRMALSLSVNDIDEKKHSDGSMGVEGDNQLTQQLNVNGSSTIKSIMVSVSPHGLAAAQQLVLSPRLADEKVCKHCGNGGRVWQGEWGCRAALSVASAVGRLNSSIPKIMALVTKAVAPVDGLANSSLVAPLNVSALFGKVACLIEGVTVLIEDHDQGGVALSLPRTKATIDMQSGLILFGASLSDVKASYRMASGIEHPVCSNMKIKTKAQAKLHMMALTELQGTISLPPSIEMNVPSPLVTSVMVSKGRLADAMTSAMGAAKLTMARAHVLMKGGALEEVTGEYDDADNSNTYESSEAVWTSVGLFNNRHEPLAFGLSCCRPNRKSNYLDVAGRLADSTQIFRCGVVVGSSLFTASVFTNIDSFQIMCDVKGSETEAIDLKFTNITAIKTADPLQWPAAISILVRGVDGQGDGDTDNDNGFCRHLILLSLPCVRTCLSILNRVWHEGLEDGAVTRMSVIAKPSDINVDANEGGWGENVIDPLALAEVELRACHEMLALAVPPASETVENLMAARHNLAVVNNNRDTETKGTGAAHVENAATAQTPVLPAIVQEEAGLDDAAVAKLEALQAMWNDGEASNDPQQQQQSQQPRQQQHESTSMEMTSQQRGLGGGKKTALNPLGVNFNPLGLDLNPLKLKRPSTAQAQADISKASAAIGKVAARAKRSLSISEGVGGAPGVSGNPALFTGSFEKPPLANVACSAEVATATVSVDAALASIDGVVLTLRDTSARTESSADTVASLKRNALDAAKQWSDDVERLREGETLAMTQIEELQSTVIRLRQELAESQNSLLACERDRDAAQADLSMARLQVADQAADITNLRGRVTALAALTPAPTPGVKASKQTKSKGKAARSATMIGGTASTSARGTQSMAIPAASDNNTRGNGGAAAGERSGGTPPVGGLSLASDDVGVGGTVTLLRRELSGDGGSDQEPIDGASEEGSQRQFDFPIGDADGVQGGTHRSSEAGVAQESLLNPPAEFMDPGWKRCAGMLRKKSGFRGKWQPRWVMMHEDCMVYIFTRDVKEGEDAEQAQLTPRGHFNASKYIVEKSHGHTHATHTFMLNLAPGQTRVKPEQKKYDFAAETERDLREWMFTFRTVCHPPV